MKDKAYRDFVDKTLKAAMANKGLAPASAEFLTTEQERLTERIARVVVRLV